MYEGVCLDCKEEVQHGLRDELNIGKYVGESSRTLAERSLEHCRGAGSLDPDSFIVKHWVLQHANLERAPRIQFKVVRTFKDPLSRLIAESVYIEKVSNLNSKSEWRNNKMSRLVVEVPSWLKKTRSEKDLSNDDESLVSRKIEELKMKREGSKTKITSQQRSTLTVPKTPTIEKYFKRPRLRNSN